MKCLIVEDDTIAAKVLQQMVEKTESLNLVKTLQSSTEAFNFLSKNPVDVLFLDIEMPEMSGLELLENLNPQPLIVFTTVNKDYAIKAFEHRAVGYLVKPISYSSFLKAVNRAKEIFYSLNPVLEESRENLQSQSERFEINSEMIFFKAEGIHVEVFFSDIIYLEALGDYVSVHTKIRKYTVHKTLKNFEDILPTVFLRVHRSYIVNISCINSIEDSTISIADKTLPIGVSHRQEVYKTLGLNS